MKVFRNLVWGLGWSAGMAGVFCAFAVFAARVNGGERFDRLDLSLGDVIRAYAIAAAIAGTILGICRPLLKSREAVWWVSGFVGVASFGAMGVLVLGPPRTWEPAMIAAVIAIGAAAGVGLGDHIRKDTNRKAPDNRSSLSS